MGEEGDLTREQKIALQRLAALQRLRDEAERSQCAGMQRSLENLIEFETRMLREPRDKPDRAS